MRIVIIGSGNVASILGRLIQRSGHEILQVISRKLDYAQELGTKLNCSFGDFHSTVNKNADIYILAVSDTALYQLSNQFSFGDKLVVHTAGSVPKHIIQNLSSSYGVLYPLQSLRKEMEEIPEIPFLIDGSNIDTLEAIRQFALTLSDKVTSATDEDRLKLHIAAVIASNFTNHLYAIAEEFCRKENVSFKILMPLIRETAARLNHYSPAELQTGPAIRHDARTLDKHLQILSRHQDMKYIYIKLSESILKFHKMN